MDHWFVCLKIISVICLIVIRVELVRFIGIIGCGIACDGFTSEIIWGHIGSGHGAAEIGVVGM